jgi:hypothetical protein
MKARVISTGRVVDVVKTIRKKTIHDYFGSQNDIEIVVYYDGKNQYTESELEFDVSSDPDYWTRLEHTYAGMAMQGILSNQDYCKLLIDENNKGSFAEDVSRCASDFANALVEKMKEERK